MEISITWGEFEFSEEFRIVHDIKSIEDIEIILFSDNQGIFHQLLKWGNS